MKLMKAANYAILTLVAGWIAVRATNAAAAQLISDNFLRMGSGEFLVAPFTSPSGTSTVGSYGGLVEIVVSGTGFSYGLNVNDAFYCAASADSRCTAVGVVLDSQYYQLNVGMRRLPFAGGEANNIDNFISFIDGVGPVSGHSIPAYVPSNLYHFVVDLPVSTPSPLSFGVSDGIYSDNGGSYDVQVFQVMQRPVPEPMTVLLFLAGLGVLGWWRRATRVVERVGFPQRSTDECLTLIGTPRGR